MAFAKRGNTNRVFAVVVQAIQLFYIGYLLNQYFTFSTGRPAAKVPAMNQMVIIWNMVIHTLAIVAPALVSMEYSTD
jgi:hypothetical protein